MVCKWNSFVLPRLKYLLDWQAFAIPIVTMSLICLFGVLFLWNRRSLKHVVFPIAQYRQELDSLGSISFEEVVVLVGVMLEVVLWLSSSWRKIFCFFFFFLEPS